MLLRLLEFDFKDRARHATSCLLANSQKLMCWKFQTKKGNISVKMELASVKKIMMKSAKKHFLQVFGQFQKCTLKMKASHPT